MFFNILKCNVFNSIEFTDKICGCNKKLIVLPPQHAVLSVIIIFVSPKYLVIRFDIKYASFFLVMLYNPTSVILKYSQDSFGLGNISDIFSNCIS